MWRRWDPHIHTPGTTLNDQYGGNGSLQAFCAKVTNITPKIEALGITDYLSISNYERIISESRNGRLEGIGLIFPNVEMRFNIATDQGAGINAHFLFCPEDKDHVAHIKRFLSNLKFHYGGEQFGCSEDELRRLGRHHNRSLNDDRSTYIEGVNQFKLKFDQLQEEWSKSDWVRRNCLIAVAAGKGDGTSGLRDSNNAFNAVRESIQSFAHIIFSSNPGDRKFWLGQGVLSLADLELKYGGSKPCLHGCDAHSLDRIGQPDEQRYCWIKGDLTFESLRQACFEPEGRVHVGAENLLQGIWQATPSIRFR